jgi:lipopolysaccharide transport system ATP-binding protein
VSFEVQPGEVVGIIGRNGAGKSTLLKILSRITEPTSGRVRLRGRVASLLEVGTGFHPELTGRENVFLNGAILGMSRQEILRQFDDIVAFAEVEKFIDTPVKRYSSGMYLRLAFAVAAHLDPEILIVDEVLAVGDTRFQDRCLRRMGEIAGDGRTVLFVSHNMDAVHAFTNTSILLAGGQIAFSGSTSKAIARHLRPSNSVQDLESFRTNSASEVLRIESITFDGMPCPKTIAIGSSHRLSIGIQTNREITFYSATAIIRDSMGRNITTFCSLDNLRTPTIPFGSSLINLELANLPLTPGHYTIDLAFNASIDAPAWDVIRYYPFLDVIIPAEEQATSLGWSNRTWGLVHLGGAHWSASTPSF